MSDSTPTTIVDGSVVTMHYTLTLGDGQTVDSSRGGDPFAYLHGAQNIVPGLETQLAGKSVGDSFDAMVEPEEGYGKRIDGAEQQVPRTQLPDDVEIVPGMPFQAETGDGNLITLYVMTVEEDTVTFDLNHPLAGETLTFAVEILGIREATEEERAHGHPHGPGGHAH